MGREIRRVPKGWEHPTKMYYNRRGEPAEDFIELYNEDYVTAAERWMKKADSWHAGCVDKDTVEDRKENPYYWDWAGMPPDKESYRPAWKTAECYQIYETVSEGTPVSPVFETEDEMLAWMILPIDRASKYNKGSDWQCMQGRTEEGARIFIKDAWAPSFIIAIPK